MALTLKIEIAFNAGYSTAAGSRTWTDVTSYVELASGIDITVGRRDELSSTEPNTLSLTLNNQDGRFTPERSSSPYYPNVKLYRPIRVTATLPDASTSVRFLGYITEWPVVWPSGNDLYSSITITASSRIARLGATTSLRSMVENEILAESPLAYYTLSDAAASTVAAESSGSGAEPLRMVGTGTAVTFGSGIGPGTDGLTAAQIATTGQSLRAPLQNIQNVRGVEAWVTIPAAPAALAVVACVDEDSKGIFPALGLVVINTGQVSALVQGVGVVTSVANVCDGALHHLYAQFTGAGNCELYVDGVVISAASTPTATVRSGTFDVGGYPYVTTPTLAMTVSHAAVHSQEISAARVASHNSAGRTITEQSGNRFQRIAGYAGISTSEILTSGCVVVVGAQDMVGKTVLDALRDVEATEAGIMYDAANGTLMLASRVDRYGATKGFTLDASKEHVQQDLSPTYGANSLINEMTVTGPLAPAFYVDATSRGDYGRAASSSDTLASDPNEPLALAQWAVNTHSQPGTRVATLTVDVLPLGTGTPSVVNVALATVGTLIGVSNLPSQAASSTGQYFVEGYTEHFLPESWEWTANVSPATPWLNTWQLDSATRSQLDSTTVTAI